MIPMGHAMGGGEAMNGYHYVSGNLLQARDPLGLHTADEVKQDASGNFEITSHMTVVVYGETEADAAAAATVLQGQAGQWNRRSYTTTTTAAGLTGPERQVTVRFRTAVRVVTQSERAGIESAARGASLTGAISEPTLRGLEEWARASGAGVNVVLAGANAMSDPDRSSVYDGGVMTYTPSNIASDRARRSFSSAHELGHMLGLGDRYRGDGEGVQDGYAGNIMGLQRGSIRRQMRLTQEQIGQIAHRAFTSVFVGHGRHPYESDSEGEGTVRSVRSSFQTNSGLLIMDIQSVGAYGTWVSRGNYGASELPHDHFDREMRF